MVDEKKGPLLEKGPGDFSEKPRVAEWRGDDGTSDAKRGEEKEASVHYDR